MNCFSSALPSGLTKKKELPSRVHRILPLVLVLSFSSCDGQSSLPSDFRLPPRTVPVPPQGFGENGPAGAMTLVTVPVVLGSATLEHTYHFQVPQGYNADKSQSYPLVVYLHPWVGPLEKNRSYAPPEILALPDSQDNPAFLYIPQCPPPYPKAGGPQYEWNSPPARSLVISTLIDLRSRYNIDPHRIYLVGFSMGGSGSWYLASEYLRVTGDRFAAVVRGAGWYLTPDREPEYKKIHEAVALSPSWIHVGETEGEGFDVGVDNYTYLKTTFGAGNEGFSLLKDGDDQVVPGNDGLEIEVRSVPLNTSGKEARLSIYKNRGHEDLMFRNRNLISWIFDQRTE